jgi:hypothetical protein
MERMEKQTAVTEILNHCKKLISGGHEIDTQGLVHWIEDKLLEMEREQIMNAWNNGFREFYDGSSTPEEYYKETYETK